MPKILNIYVLGTKRGDFCYGLKGEIGTVDDNMCDVPINVECDPRQSCTHSSRILDCISENPDIEQIPVSNQHSIRNSLRHKVLSIYELIPYKISFSISNKTLEAEA